MRNWEPAPGMRVRRLRNDDSEMFLVLGEIYVLDRACADGCGNWTLEKFMGIAGTQRPLFHPDNFEPAIARGLESIPSSGERLGNMGIFPKKGSEARDRLRQNNAGDWVEDHFSRAFPGERRPTE